MTANLGLRYSHVTNVFLYLYGTAHIQAYVTRGSGGGGGRGGAGG